MNEVQNPSLVQLTENPREFFIRQHNDHMKLVDNLHGLTIQNLGQGLTSFLGKFRSIIEFQSMELSLHRELETRIRTGTVSEEGIKEYQKNLDDLRNEFSAKVQVKATPGPTAVAVNK